MITHSQSGRLLVERRRPGFESTGAAAGDWAVAPVPPRPGVHPWDEAHQAVRNPTAAGFESTAAPDYAEPDFVQAFPFPRADSGGLESFTGDPCAARGPDGYWPTGVHGWHLDSGHSQLRAARERVGDPPGARVRIAHLDTGFDPGHASLPLHLLLELARNFAGGHPQDATDPGRHSPVNQPGHGTATLALLAGNRIAVSGTGFDEFLGGAPFAEVVPIRIADSVIHFHSSSMAAGLNYAADIGAGVVSISMGGMPARAWAAAVNRCYEAGVAVFAAAGNRFGPSPPWTTVWPARFGRVVAVTGVTADGTPYHRSGLHREMQGCHGPPGKMQTALAAYTPNTPWAMMGCGGGVDFGGGTSSATPQAAAAAALWLTSHPAPAGTAPWQRVEAVRHALFASADRSHTDYETYFGRGVLKADAALSEPFLTNLPPIPADDVRFPWVRMVGGFESDAPVNGVEQMFEVEALQLYLRSPELQRLAGGADPLEDPLPFTDRRALLLAMQRVPHASNALRQRLKEAARMP